MDRDPGQTLSCDTWGTMPLSLVSRGQNHLVSVTDVQRLVSLDIFMILVYRVQYHLQYLTDVLRSVSRTVVDLVQWQESQDQTLSDW